MQTTTTPMTPTFTTTPSTSIVSTTTLAPTFTTADIDYCVVNNKYLLDKLPECINETENNNSIVNAKKYVLISMICSIVFFIFTGILYKVTSTFGIPVISFAFLFIFSISVMIYCMIQKNSFEQKIEECRLASNEKTKNCRLTT